MILSDFNISINFFFHNKIGCSKFCQRLFLRLKNGILKHQGEYQGIYELSECPDDIPSWVFRDNNKAIWYNEEYNSWAIGELQDYGKAYSEISSSDGYHGNYNPLHVGRGNWHYQNDGQWEDVEKKDLRIICKD